MKPVLVHGVIITLFWVVVQGKSIVFNNTAPRLSNDGQIIDSHDGSIQRFDPNGPYYVHAMQYGLCKEPANYGCDQTPDHCGFQQDHNITIWKSYDLSSGSWEYVGNAIDVAARPAGVVFRPHIVFNPNTKLYVLWLNYDNSSGAWLAAATAPTPEGPFTLQISQINITQKQSGDYALFVDDDGSGYVVYSCNYTMHIEKLTDDFLHSSGERGLDFGEYFVEAPAMFKRKGVYYVLFGYCCCFCEQGSGIIVHTSTAPLGPYTSQSSGDIACIQAQEQKDEISWGLGAIPTPSQGCQYKNSTQTSVTRSQQNFIIQVDTPAGLEYIWTGDRWQQAPDGIKGHEPQYWVPLVFNNDGSIQEVSWVAEFEVDVV